MKKDTENSKPAKKDAGASKKAAEVQDSPINPWDLAKKAKSEPPADKKEKAPQRPKRPEGKSPWASKAKPSTKAVSKPVKSKSPRKKAGKSRTVSTTKAPEAASSSPSPRAAEGIRLNRYISLAGICARRKADELIADGRVKVNGEVVTQMGIRVSASDVVEVGGNRITPLGHEYILLNKPSNFITTNSDEKDRKIVMDLIEDPEIKKSGIFPVGRLDRNTVGILLLTNDGELAHRLMHPRFQIDKLYHVTTESPVLPHQLAELKGGVEVDGESLNLDDVQYINLPRKNELGILLHEGKNRHIRRMLAAVGHESINLERVKYAGLSTEGVRRGKWRRLTKIEIKRLKRLVKLK